MRQKRKWVVSRLISRSTPRQIKHRASAKRTIVRTEPSNQPGNFFDGPKSIQRRSGDHGVDRFRGKLSDEIGVYRRRSNDVHAYRRVGELLSERLCKGRPRRRSRMSKRRGW